MTQEATHNVSVFDCDHNPQGSQATLTTEELTHRETIDTLTNEFSDCAMKIDESVRPELASFAIEMETVLRENDHKTGWNEMSVHQLFHRIKNEFEELQQEYIIQKNSLGGVNQRDRLRKEAIDIANFCMFLTYWTHKKD